MQRFSVIFDLDGVLLDSAALARLSFEYAYRVCVGSGAPPTDAFFARMGQSLESIVSALQLPDAFPEQFRNKAREQAHLVVPFPGVHEMLEQLKSEGFKLGVVTGKDRPRTLALMQQCRIAEFFGMIVTPDDAPPKPNPEPIWTCIRGLGGAVATGFFGDSKTDMLAAKRAGVTGYMVTWGGETSNLDRLHIAQPSDVVDICRSAARQQSRPTV